MRDYIPSWVHWTAIDYNGEKWGYEFEPKISTLSLSWNEYTGRSWPIENGLICEDWRQSKRCMYMKHSMDES